MFISLKLTRESLQDIFKVAAKTGAKILKEIIAYQARLIRNSKKLSFFITQKEI